jgi:hypothetical protein
VEFRYYIRHLVLLGYGHAGKCPGLGGGEGSETVLPISEQRILLGREQIEKYEALDY